MKFLLKDGSLHEIPSSDIAMLRRVFPEVDLAREFAKLALWCEANPRKRKTKRGARRFYVSWISRAAERRGPARSYERV